MLSIISGIPINLILQLYGYNTAKVGIKHQSVNQYYPYNIVLEQILVKLVVFSSQKCLR
jgi:hypothetical protein